jgi:hypothetical protein
MQKRHQQVVLHAISSDTWGQVCLKVKGILAPHHHRHKILATPAQAKANSSVLSVQNDQLAK